MVWTEKASVKVSNANQKMQETIWNNQR